MAEQVNPWDLTNEEIYAKFEKALFQLYAKDYYILENDAHERSVAARLAMYLRDSFEKGNTQIKVDVEYNRVGKQSVKGIVEYSNGKKGEKNVFPDIIIHKRGQYRGNNILCCEIKKNDGIGTKSFGIDHDKCKKFINQLKYQTAMQIYKLNKDCVCLIWFIRYSSKEKKYKYSYDGNRLCEKEEIS